MAKTVKDYIRTIVDFPHEGILFRDVTTLFADPRGFRMCVDQLLAPYAGMRIDKVAGLEARGFILGGAVAHQLSTGFIPIRKKGKLPGATISESYKLEYGEATVEVHDDAIQPGDGAAIIAGATSLRQLKSGARKKSGGVFLQPSFGRRGDNQFLAAHAAPPRRSIQMAAPTAGTSSCAPSVLSSRS